MVLRLLLGLLKGALIGGLLGLGLAYAGLGAPGALVAYPVAVLAGMLVGLVAGKPIWAEGARIEAGMKAFAGALFAAGLLWAVRSWLAVPLPNVLGPLLEANRSLAQAGPTLGGSAITSLALVTAALGGFFDADNTPTSQGSAPPAARVRVAPTAPADPELEALLAEEDEPREAREKGRGA